MQELLIQGTNMPKLTVEMIKEVTKAVAAGIPVTIIGVELPAIPKG